MFCKKCGCYIPSFEESCPSCDNHKSLTTKYDTVRFEIWGKIYTCQITTMHENKDGSVSFRMRSEV